MDIEKLIRRLRNDADAYRNGETLGRAFADQEDVLDNAATALSTLKAENEKLRAQLDHLRSEPGQELWSEENQRADRLAAELERARKDNKRLCAAMMTIRKSENLERMCVVYEMDYAAVLSHDFVQDIARIVFDGLMLEDLKRRGQKED